MSERLKQAAEDLDSADGLGKVTDLASAYREPLGANFTGTEFKRFAHPQENNSSKDGVGLGNSKQFELLPGYIPPTKLPENWERAQLRDVATIVQGGRLGLTKSEYREYGFPAYSAAGQDGFVGEAEFTQPGIVLASIGSCGRCYQANNAWTTLANTQAILPLASIVDHRFLWARIDDVCFWEISGSAQPFIKPSSVQNSWIALPPLEEQRSIAEVLDSVDDAIAASERVIAKRKLLRAGLASDLLTGKVRTLSLSSASTRSDATDREDCEHPTGKTKTLPNSFLKPATNFGIGKQLGCKVGTTLTSAPNPATARQPGDKVQSSSPNLHGRSEVQPRFEKGANPGNLNTAEWRNRRLGCVAVVKMGQSPPGHLVKQLRKGLPFLQGNAEFGMEFPMARLQCDDSPKRSIRGDTLISVRAPVGAINRSNLEYGIGRGLAAISFVSVDSDFGHHSLAEHSRKLNVVEQGTTFSAIGRAELEELELPIPPVGEQRWIARILDDMDESIRAEERRRDKLKMLRAGLADDLLSGRVRTVEA